MSLRLCQIYVLLVLLAASVTSALPYPLLALALLLVALVSTFRTLPPRLGLAITVSFMFLMPLVVEPLLEHLTSFPPLSVAILAAASILPVMYILDSSLRQNAQYVVPSAGGPAKGRYISNISISLPVSVLVVLLISFILSNHVLVFTAIIFVLYLAAILLRVLLTVPRHPVEVPVAWRRVIAGGTISVGQYIVSRAAIRLHARISPVDSYVKVTPRRFVLNQNKIELNLTITPPLAGPSRPQIRVSTLDPWGLIHTDQLVEPVELHVIPRARYAAWLAMRYLEQAKTGVIGTATLPPRAIIMPKRGIEYHDSRPYHPGDQLRDIDWKHTIKLNQLIIKEYVEGGKQAAIIAVNLSVAGIEEADRLAFNLITAALTLAEEGIPAALAAYDHQSVVLTLSITDPREILRQALSLVKDIDVIESTSRCLELPDLGRLRRNLTQLKVAQSEPAQRLLSMLNFEYRAIEAAAQNHPATLALSSVIERMPAPAMILLVSQLNHDAEAIQVATEKLSRREFTIMPVDGNR